MEGVVLDLTEIDLGQIDMTEIDLLEMDHAELGLYYMAFCCGQACARYRIF